MSVSIQFDDRAGRIKLERDLRKFSARLPAEIKGALLESARFVQSTARKWCPQSPTKSQSRAYTGPSTSRFHPGRAPGTLRNAIEIRKKAREVDIGVFSGSALQYANYIHNRQHKAIRGWEFLGPGNTQFRGKKGGKFLDRALSHHGKDIDALFGEMLDKL